MASRFIVHFVKEKNGDSIEGGTILVIAILLIPVALLYKWLLNLD
jgi:hypothetical protein